MSEISNNQLAQKVDDLATAVENLARATNEGFESVKSELRTEMHEGFARVKSELREEMKEMKTELSEEMKEMKTDLRSEMKDMKEELVDLLNRKDEQNKEDIRNLYTITGRLS